MIVLLDFFFRFLFPAHAVSFFDVFQRHFLLAWSPISFECPSATSVSNPAVCLYRSNHCLLADSQSVSRVREPGVPFQRQTPKFLWSGQPQRVLQSPKRPRAEPSTKTSYTGLSSLRLAFGVFFLYPFFLEVSRFWCFAGASFAPLAVHCMSDSDVQIWFWTLKCLCVRRRLQQLVLALCLKTKRDFC